ncbi:MAG: hypothetical protein ACOC14_01610 [Bacillota bacterium]
MQPFRFKKGIDYYVRVLISASIALFIYGLIELLWRDAPYWESVMDFWYLPIFVTVFLWFYNVLTDKLYSPMDAKSEKNEFIFEISRAVRKELDYDKESFQQIKKDKAFQQLIQDAYTIFQSGEKEGLSLDDLQRRFDSDSKHQEAARVVIEKTRELRNKYKAPRK